jgi:hypothetical protein
MWQLLKQLEDIKDMADLVGNRFHSDCERGSRKAFKVMLNLITDQDE